MITSNLKILQILGLAASLFLFTACTEKKVQRETHDQGKITQKNILEEVDLTKVQDPQLKQKLQGALNTLSNQGANAESLWKIIADLEGLVLNQQTLEKITSANSDDFKKTLMVFNTAILKISENKEELKNEKFKELMKKYLSTVQLGCSDENTGCRNLKIFKDDYQSHRVLMISAVALDPEIEANKAQKDKLKLVLDKYYRILGLSIELKNSAKDPDLDFLYLKYAKMYGEIYHDLQGYKSRETYERHGQIFENIIKNFEGNKDSNEFSKFIKDFQPWGYSHLNQNPFPFGTRQIFRFAAKHFLYEKNGALSEEMSTAIKLSQEKADKKGPSFSMQINTILRDASIRAAFKSLKIDVRSISDQNFLDEYFYIIDRLYRGHIDSVEAGEIWQGSKKDSARIYKVVESYLQVQFLDMIIKTFRYMKEVYSKPGISGKNLIKESIEKSRIIYDDWQTMISRFEGTILDFLGQELRSSNQEAQVLNDSEKIVKSVRRNIKFMVSYPLMLVLLNYAVDLDGKFDVESFWGKFQISAADILGNVFAGREKPWFNFGNDMNLLKKVELIYAYFYALATGSFDIFHAKSTAATRADRSKSDNDKSKPSANDEKGAEAVDKKTYLIKILDKILRNDIEALKEILKNIDLHKAQNSDYNSYLNYCKLMKAKTHFSVPSMEAVTESGNQPSFKQQSLFWGKNDYNDGLAKVEVGKLKLAGLLQFEKIMVPNKNFVYGKFSLLSVVAGSSVDQRLDLARNFVDVYISNQQALNTGTRSPRDLETLREELMKPVQEAEDLIQKIYVDAVKTYKESNECLKQIVEAEHDRQYELVEKEKNHLKTIYKQIKDMRASGTGPVDITDPTPGMDVVTQQAYYFNGFAMIKRWGGWMQNMYPRASLSYPAENVIKELGIYQYPVRIAVVEGEGLISEQQFIESVFRKAVFNSQIMSFGTESYGSWFNFPSIFSYLLDHYNNMGLILRHGVVKNLAERISVDDLLKDYIWLLKFVEIKDRDQLVLKALGLTQKISSTNLSNANYLLDSGFRPTGIFDSFINSISSFDEVLNDAKANYLINANMGYFVFKADDKIPSLVYYQVRSKIDRFEALMNEIISKIQNFEKSNVVDLKIPYEWNNNINIIFQPRINSSGSEALLLDRTVSEYTNYMERFHTRDTVGYYRTEIPVKQEPNSQPEGDK